MTESRPKRTPVVATIFHRLRFAAIAPELILFSSTRLCDRTRNELQEC